jgi:hypothetical protein
MMQDNIGVVSVLRLFLFFSFLSIQQIPGREAPSFLTDSS